MYPPGMKLLKVVSILFIIAGAFAFLASLSGVAGSALLASLNAGAAGATTVAMITSALLGVLEIIFGSMGIKRCSIPEKWKFFLAAGIVICAVQLLDMLLQSLSSGFFQIAGLFGFVLPVLYIIGGLKLKASADSQSPY